MKIIIIVTLFIISSSMFLFASRKDVGTTSYNFLKLNGSARASALGSAFTAVTDDVSSIFYNPAGAVSLRTNNVSMNYVNYFLDVNYQTIFFNLPHNDNENFFAGAFYLDGGEITKYHTNDIAQGTARFYNLAVFLGYGSKRNRVSYAGTMKILNETIHDDSILGVAFDFGFLFDIREEHIFQPFGSDLTRFLSFSDINLGLVFKNIGFTTAYGEANSDKLPNMTALGVSSKYMNQFMFSLDYLIQNDNKNSLSFGAEYYFNEYLTFRGGYDFNQEKYEKGFSFGAGFKFFLFNDMIFDVSYEQHRLLGDITGVNLSVIF